MASLPSPERFRWTAPELDRASLLAPVLVQTAVDATVERLVTGLALGLYLPGHKLPAERDLAERLGVSRNTLREALSQMEELGYVETRRGRLGGTFVKDGWGDSTPSLVARVLGDSWPQYEDLFDLARELMPLIARLAADRRTTDDLDAIAEAAERYETSTVREEVRRADADLHAAIARATQNAYFVSAEAQLRWQLTLGTGAFPYSDQIHAQAAEEHRRLVDHLRAGDGEVAAEVALGHFIELGETVIRALHAKSQG